MRAINTKDTYAMQLARKMGFNVVIITGGKSEKLRNGAEQAGSD